MRAAPRPARAPCPAEDARPLQRPASARPQETRAALGLGLVELDHEGQVRLSFAATPLHLLL
eukprot:5180904-Alexandrium_andersonii.AAC.1